MMDHATANSRLSAYLDQELRPEMRSEVESHLLTCFECQADLRSLQQTSSFLQRLPLSSVTAATLARLHGAIDRAGARKPIPAVERFIALLSGVAACLAVVGTLMVVQPRAVAAPSASAAWERDAVQLAPADPSEAAPENAIGNWMVANIGSRGELP